jgi:hypothetical protein
VILRILTHLGYLPAPRRAHPRGGPIYSKRFALQAKTGSAIGPIKCRCYKGWVCEDHPEQPWEHDGCGAAGELCKNPKCNKDPDSIFLSVDRQVQPEEENRQLEKLELTREEQRLYEIVG